MKWPTTMTGTGGYLSGELRGIKEQNVSLRLENLKLKEILRKLLPEKSGHFFVCGEIGEKDSMGLPESILVCPHYGLEGFAVYKKDKDYSEPMW